LTQFSMSSGRRRRAVTACKVCCHDVVEMSLFSETVL
jgi:hypothetical protein